MENQLTNLISNIKAAWKKPGDEAKLAIGALLKEFSLNKQVLSKLAIDHPAEGLELYRDKEEGFILFAYTESEGIYRFPHDHGNCWVIYVVVTGLMEMGEFKKTDSDLKVALQGKQILNAGDVRVYNPGYIHDTRCLSSKSTILRLTSCDLKKEELEGRMLKFHL